MVAINCCVSLILDELNDHDLLLKMDSKLHEIIESNDVHIDAIETSLSQLRSEKKNAENKVFALEKENAMLKKAILLQKVVSCTLSSVLTNYRKQESKRMSRCKIVYIKT